MFEKMFDILMVVCTVAGLAMPFFGITLGSVLLAAPAGAYTGNVIGKFITKSYN